MPDKLTKGRNPLQSKEADAMNPWHWIGFAVFAFMALVSFMLVRPLANRVTGTVTNSANQASGAVEGYAAGGGGL